MRTGTSRNIATAVIVVFVLVVVAAAIYVGFRLSQSQTPASTGAAGFGADATTTNFTNIRNAFAAVSCDYFFDSSYRAISTEPEIITLSADYTGNVAESSTGSVYAKKCAYNFKNGRTIQMSVTPYNVDSVIDASAEALYTRVNRNLASVTADGLINTKIKFFFGPDATTGECRLNMYHTQNDFEHLTLLLKGFSKNCPALTNMAKGLAEVFSYPINDVMLPFLIPDLGSAQ